MAVGVLKTQDILDFIARGASISCPSTSTESYGVGSVPNPDPNAHSNPDTVLSLKGWEPFAGDLGLVTYGYPAGEPPDPRAPQLGTILNNGPEFRALYQIRNYDPANYNNPPHLAGLSSDVGQIVLAPENGYDIGGGYQYKVIYATQNELTMNVLGTDYAIEGYSMHFVDMCVDPNLVALYTKLHNEGRRFLPAVKKGQRLGVAKSSEVKVAIRDSGSYLDPRSKLDWWQNYAVHPNPTIPGRVVPPTRKPTRKPIPPTPTLPPNVTPSVTPVGWSPSPIPIEPTEVIKDEEDYIDDEVIVDEVVPTESESGGEPFRFTLFEDAGNFVKNTIASILNFFQTVAP